MYKRLACNQQTRQLMYGYEETENTRREELTIKKNRITNNFVRIKLKDLFGCTHAVKRNSVNDSIIRENAIALTKIVLKDFGRYISHYTWKASSS